MFFSDHARLIKISAFAAWLAPFRKSEWVVYAKPPFGGPEAVLAYLSRYTHCVAISNNRLVSADAGAVAFHWKDYRIKTGDRQKLMMLTTDEFIRPAPRGFVLPRFVTMDRQFSAASVTTRSTSKNLQGSRRLYCRSAPAAFDEHCQSL